MNNPSDDHVVIEPELSTEPEDPNTKATFDEPPPQDHNVDEQARVDTAVLDDEPASPIRADDRRSSPVRTTDIPSTPEKAAGDKEGEVIITDISHTSPGHHVILAKHSAKEERAAMEKRQMEHRLVNLRPSQRSRAPLWFSKPSALKP